MSNTIAFVGIQLLHPPEQGVDSNAAGVEYVFSDGTKAPGQTGPQSQTNANDPVSPQRASMSMGVVPPVVPVGILHAYPDDPSLTPQYTPPTP